MTGKQRSEILIASLVGGGISHVVIAIIEKVFA